MVVSICVGSNCHLKGSREVLKQLSLLIEEHQLQDKVELVGSFCNGQCVGDIWVRVDGTLFSLRAEDTKTFFEEEILSKVR